MIDKKIRLEQAVGLLRSNFELSDWALLEELTVSDLDRDTFHAMSFDIEHVFEDHQDNEGVPSLLNLYEYNPCSACRERLVELLYSLGQLPDHIREECKYDANIYLRKWILETFESK
jgi:hypothetical protein